MPPRRTPRTQACKAPSGSLANEKRKELPRCPPSTRSAATTSQRFADLRQIEFPDVLEAASPPRRLSSITSRQSGASRRTCVDAKLPCTIRPPDSAEVGRRHRSAALPLADPLVGDRRLGIVCRRPGMARLALRVVGIGIEQPRRIGQIQHPLADVAGVPRVVAGKRHDRTGPLIRVHGKRVAFAVGRAADQAVHILTMPAIGDHAPARPRLRAEHAASKHWFTSLATS